MAPVPGWVPMAKVTAAAELVTTLPDWSSTLTLGWVAQAVPSTPPPGWALKTVGRLAAPKVMEKALLVTVVNPVAAAVSV